ncbi:hypothetical protein Sp245p_16325 (plasmid) [Azospirillum baldaniorum]|uniref:Uncharacterized protein n=1 Tax=Azospirillum baldaniorum TaxID=1064539 RepID=A0A9P1JTU1_9PROT|nr:hypothetical protein [Azospirillum baldaniorum]AWJ91411.1 hypothetical protein Sp245p_16325 [Azospirillum baldaniorum]TWA70707.1 hypothetical protein FBZ84_102257 [Azospirillum baldaniorum]TWA83733.1 hypothetical protein FBZ85_101482 [Azospirillum brasilense]CCC99699.1 protein of unknown function [Azospirillum baldaniorum]
MAKTTIVQTSFAAGELDPSLAMRHDVQQYQAGARRMTNCRLLVGGGARRREGTRWLAELVADGRAIPWAVDEATKYVIVLSTGRMDAFREDGTPAGTLTGCPWSVAQARAATWFQSANTLFLAHPDFPVQRIARTGPSSWAREAIAFAMPAGVGGRLHQPYFKVAPDSITLQPSARAGGITLTASGGWWQSGHVGSRVRYAGREIVINSISSSAVANATVVDELPPSQDVTVDDAAGWRVGQVVEGDETGARGEVVAMPSGTVLRIVVEERVSGFKVGEYVTGPESRAKVAAVATVDPAPSRNWDEQLYGPVHGYPAAVALHRGRLILAGGRAVPNIVCASRTDALYDFDIGDAVDTDAVIDLIGDAAAQRIVQVVSTEQLLVLTDRGAYYNAESPSRPFTPTNFGLLPFGSPWPASNARAETFDNGVILVTGSTIVKLSPTGDTTAQWTGAPTSLLASHTIKAPLDAAFTTGWYGGVETYGFFVNSDGTMTCMQLLESQQVRSFVPWTITGSVRSAAALGDELFLVTHRSVDGVDKHLLEKVDPSLSLDAATTYADLDDAAARYGTLPGAHVVAGRYALGGLPQTDPAADGPYDVGLDFPWVIETLPPVVQGRAGPVVHDTMRICRVWVELQDSFRLSVSGQTLTAYAVTDDLSEAPLQRNGPQEFRLLGRSRRPTITIQAPEPLPVTVLGLSMEVSV